MAQCSLAASLSLQKFLTAQEDSGLVLARGLAIPPVNHSAAQSRGAATATCRFYRGLGRFTLEGVDEA